MPDTVPELPDRQRQPDTQTQEMASVVRPPCDSQVPVSEASLAPTIPGKPDTFHTPSEAVVNTMHPSPEPTAPPAPSPVLASGPSAEAEDRGLTPTIAEESEPGDSVSHAGPPSRDGYWRPQ